MNLLNREWTPVDKETAEVFLRNVVDYPNLPFKKFVRPTQRFLPWYEVLRKQSPLASFLGY